MTKLDEQEKIENLNEEASNLLIKGSDMLIQVEKFYTEFEESENLSQERCVDILNVVDESIQLYNDVIELIEKYLSSSSIDGEQREEYKSVLVALQLIIVGLEEDKESIKSYIQEHAMA